MAEPARHFTVTTLADYWAVDPETVRRLIKKRRLAHLPVGAAIRIPAKCVEAYEKANLCPAKPDQSRNSNLKKSPDGDTGTSSGLSAADQRKFQRARMTGPKPGPGCPGGSENVTPFPNQGHAP